MRCTGATRTCGARGARGEGEHGVNDGVGKQEVGRGRQGVGGRRRRPRGRAAGDPGTRGTADPRNPGSGRSSSRASSSIARGTRSSATRRDRSTRRTCAGFLVRPRVVQGLARRSTPRTWTSSSRAWRAGCVRRYVLRPRPGRRRCMSSLCRRGGRGVERTRRTRRTRSRPSPRGASRGSAQRATLVVAGSGKAAETAKRAGLANVVDVAPTLEALLEGSGAGAGSVGFFFSTRRSAALVPSRR